MASPSTCPTPPTTGPRRRTAPLDTPDVRLMADATPHIVWMASPEGATTYFNEHGTAYTGCPRETTYGWNWVALVHPDDTQPTQAAWDTAVRTESEFLLDYRIRRFDGEFRWHEVRTRPARDPDG